MTPTATTAEALLRGGGPLLGDLVADIVAAVACQLDAWAAEGLVYGTVQSAEIDLIINGDALVEARLTGFPSPLEVLSPTVLMANARYLAPELLHGKVFGAGADPYALACTAYELLTSTPPFAGGSVSEMLERASGGAVPTTDLPGDLDVVLVTALAPDSRDRYATAGEFAEALRRAAEGGRSAGLLM